VELIDKEKCSGCTACANICPRKCINMVADNEGFLYPQIIDTVCVDCGLCRKVCPIGKSEKHNPFSVYAVKNKDDDARLNSTSGAMFTLLSDYILERNGVVFGCKLDENLQAVHDFAETKEGIKVFRGAKYIQSILDDTFKKVKKFLLDGRYVLFTGTPCQVAGLSAYLGKEYDNLIKCDLVCHSVPSPKALEAYINELEKEKKSKAIEICFREKILEGWKRSNLRVNFENGEVYREVLKENVFMKGFNNGLFNRTSCANCSYKDFKGSSDITIADYWGIEKVSEEFADNLGVSLVFVNTKNGEKLFEKIKEKLNYIETTIEDAVLKNPYIVTSSPKHENRKNFFDNIDKNDFSDLVMNLLK